MSPLSVTIVTFDTMETIKILHVHGFQKLSQKNAITYKVSISVAGRKMTCVSLNDDPVHI